MQTRKHYDVPTFEEVEEGVRKSAEDDAPDVPADFAIELRALRDDGESGEIGAIEVRATVTQTRYEP